MIFFVHTAEVVVGSLTKVRGFFTRLWRDSKRRECLNGLVEYADWLSEDDYWAEGTRDYFARVARYAMLVKDDNGSADRS